MRFSQNRAFTLIEMLVVIAIIGVLISLLFPVVGTALNSARKAQANNDATQILNACTAYETEYGVGVWGSNVSPQVDTEMLQSLMGTNARGIVFLEVQNAKGHTHGYTNGAYIDPWGGVYQIAYDTSYSNTITTAGTNGTNVVRGTYAIWTDPSKQQWYTNLVPSQRYIQTW